METKNPASNPTSNTGARRQAERRFADLTRRDAEVMALQQKRWDMEAEKIARLRALRLARDAELAAQARADAGKTPAQRKRSKAASSAGKARKVTVE